MRLIRIIREFFWPLLEGEISNQSAKLNPEDINVNSGQLERTLNLAIKCYEEENDRKKIVEGKASLFIGTISIITSVIIGVTTVLMKSEDFQDSILILVFLLFILTLYMTRTIWFSIKTLERKSFNSLSIEDLLVNDQSDNYYKRLIAEITNKLKSNSIVINSKVDYMTMSQEYFKRSIVVVVLYAFFILLFLLSKYGVDVPKLFSQSVGIINSISLTGWNIIILYSISITSLIISLIVLKRKK